MLGRRSPRRFIAMVAGVILVDQIEEVDNKARVPVLTVRRYSSRVMFFCSYF